jgi:hypothetical protein
MNEEHEDDFAVLGDFTQIVGRVASLAKTSLHQLVCEQA